MGLFPEREPQIPVQERATEPQIPSGAESYIEKVEKEVELQSPVTDTTGQVIVSPPAPQQVTIQIPMSQTSLSSLSRGSSAYSITWFATFWLRMIKKALLLGWRLIFPEKGG